MSKPVKIRLSSDLMPPLIIIVFSLGEHIINNPNSQHIQLGHRKAELFASQEKQGRCHRAVSFAMFF